MRGRQCDGFQRLFMVAVRFAHCLGDYFGDWMVRKVSDKERLEVVVENVVFLRGLTGTLNAELPEDDFWYLYDQAERVQELERKIERYREALEFYANEETYETKFATDTDEIFDPFTLIELDEGKKARQALEGEKHD